MKNIKTFEGFTGKYNTSEETERIVVDKKLKISQVKFLKIKNLNQNTQIQILVKNQQTNLSNMLNLKILKMKNSQKSPYLDY